MTRVLQHGSVEYVWVSLDTLDSDDDLSGITVELSVSPRFEPLTWSAPDDQEAVSANRLRVARLVTASRRNGVETPYYVFARVTTAAETMIIYCGTFTVQ